MDKDIWPIDGSKHHDVSRSSLYANRRVNRFLDGDQHTLLVAAKGMGKTLLLRAKKRMLEDDPEGLLIIPRNAEYDDPQLHGTLASSGYGNTAFWEDLWVSSIVFSILTHRWRHAHDKVDNEGLERYIQNLDIDHKFQTHLIAEISEQVETPPSFYLADLLDRSIGSIQKFLRSVHHVDVISNLYITNPVCVFIDAFDQTLTRHFGKDPDTWRCAQLGLCKAAHRLNTKNRHIKIYATIRQEAYSGFSDDDREVIKGSSILLEYSKRELKDMFEHAIKKYSNHDSIEEFLHLSTVHNGSTGEEEELFDYLYRHSTSTPRSIMYFGQILHQLKLDDLPETEREDEVRKEVNRIGSENIYEDYLVSQQQIFLSTLSSTDAIEKLFALIPANVLTGSSLASINREYRRIYDVDEQLPDPLFELYNIGLLGIVRIDPATNKQKQYFRKPYDFTWSSQSTFKESATYLVHPSLLSRITDVRGSTYYLNCLNIIGDDRFWHTLEGGNGLPLLFISHSSYDKPKIEEILPTFEHSMNMRLPSDIWYDRWSIKAGGDIHQEIEKGVKGSDLVVVFVSEESLASGWVEKEWRSKHYDEISTNKIQLIAVIIDSTTPEELPYFLRTKKAVRLPAFDTQEYYQVLDQLCIDIAHHVSVIN